MQPCIRNAGEPLCLWKLGITELFLLQPSRICLLVCLCPARISPGQFLIARVSKGHHKSLSGFISPCSKKSFSPPPPHPGLLLPPWRSTPVPQLTLHGGVRLPGFLQVHGGVITRGFILPAVQHKGTSLAVVALQPPPRHACPQLVLGGLFLMLLAARGALTVPPPYVPVALPESVA